MTLKSVLDTRSPGYAEAADAMTAKLAELEAEHAKALAGGGEKYVDAPPCPRQADPAGTHRGAARS